MKIAYVVTAGCYSDYGIYGVFSTKKKAETYISRGKAVNEYWASEADIEEWIVDENMKMTQHTLWQVGMLLDDGSVVENYVSDRFSIPCNKVVQLGVCIPFYQNRPIVRVHSVKSEKHALKLAVEARQGWLREQALVPKEGK